MYPQAYIQFLVQFHGFRDYFECHEILEEHWKEHDFENRTSVWVGLIQTAVGLYHYRRKNKKGAVKIWTSARSIIEKNRKQLFDLGVHAEILCRLVEKHLADAKNNQPFEDMNLPLMDPELIKWCAAECERRGVNWQQPSDMSDQQLIHRHILRHGTADPETRLHKKRNI
ncbi:DUF309 domain-containing protein [Salibacterium halotolerans]|uniref:DUF309 domain-containing protein n=1 Tax=Salibacterium halotolerans TaxID=1884432 RepID=A0A1I5NVD0_9BACI|nr:DUF309 domain-containing protein [Salibacterium halotolerans]SFP25590.1 hypothetical protein SAMN05518683_103288 [Salibacterium halotolerans]